MWVMTRLHAAARIRELRYNIRGEMNGMPFAEMSGLRLFLAGRSGVCGRRHSHYRLEIPDEVGLVAVTQVQGNRGLTVRCAGRQLFRGLVKPVTLNHPLGTYPDVPREQSLQRSFVQAVAVDEVFHLEDPSILRHGIDDLRYPKDILIRLGPAGAEEILNDVDAGYVLAESEDRAIQVVAFRAEDVVKGRCRVRKLRHRDTHKWVEPSRRELNREHAALVLK